MNLNHSNISKYIDSIAHENIVDLSKVTFFDPWSITTICLLLGEKYKGSNKILILPENSAALSYLKRVHFQEYLVEIGYQDQLGRLPGLLVPEYPNLNICELKHCEHMDELNGRLEYIAKMFEDFGLDYKDSRLATSIVAELGNNTFDHNLGKWPLSLIGCLILGQRYPQLKEIRVTVADPGIGFFGSLSNLFTDLKSDKDAIIKGLEGNSARVGQNRGKGLKLIQDWTIKNFSGYIKIHSKEGIVCVDDKGYEPSDIYKIPGTIAQIIICYK